MPETQTAQAEDVLTLVEAAAYLRVPEAELLRLVEAHDVPAQKIGGEWRFLKKALGEWLWHGHDFQRWSSPWSLDRTVLAELLFLVEKRLLDKLSAERPARGSKQAVLKHSGVFEDDTDMDEMLADIRARRKAAGG
jgi:excisionase family DNA binding protein